MWQKGESGNPHGRPKKGESLTDALRAKADKEALADKLLALAKEGNFMALRYVYDRVDGLPKQTVETNAPLIGQLAELWTAVGHEAGPESETDGDPGDLPEGD